ncbi:substrate-binding domain-containing protein [Achromobacter mucicolens]|nr:substrate-binding domain-containing protein [Achromobacter mucicolens]
MKSPTSGERGRIPILFGLYRAGSGRERSGLQAIFCSADALAAGVLTEARVRGLRVPQDLAVCGFGGADFAAHLAPSLTPRSRRARAECRHSPDRALPPFPPPHASG